MNELIDFTNCKEEINEYKGSEKKKTLIYNDKKYLVKFPDPFIKNKKLSYINNAFSEYVGSKIFELTGFDTQKTVLGIYKVDEKEKIVCACEDFTDENNTLYEFENFTNSSLLDRKVETEIDDIMTIITENSKLIDAKDTIKKFWKMFVVDFLIGNSDRHNGNWGFLKNNKTGEVSFSPIFDCGSCLNPLLEEEEIEKITDTELKNIVLNCYSCLKISGKKINYSQYILNCENNEVRDDIIYVYPKINLDKINKMIDEISCMSDIRKNFYKTIIKERYVKVLTPVYNKLKNK